MKFVKYLILIIFTGLCFAALNRLFAPKYVYPMVEGRLTREYYMSDKNHNVVFFGSCEVFNSFSPPALLRSYGLTSFVRGGAQQLVWHSYYLLEDTLRYETPDVVVFNVVAMKYGEPQSEGYNRLNLEGMAFSKTKIRAVRASVMPDENESLLSYFIHILRYKDRWKDLKREDFTYFFRRERISQNGFLASEIVEPADLENYLRGRRLADYSFAEKCWDYLDKMRLLCEANGIDFVLVKSPNIYPYWHNEWDIQIREYADRHGILYINFLHYADDIGLDFLTDTSNAGYNLNVFGAEKLTEYFGQILVEKFNFKER